MKECSKCKNTKSVEEYYKKNNSPDKLNCWCKSCVKQDCNRYNNQNKTKLYSKRKEWVSKWNEGVYGIFADGYCLYIGESSQLRKRISNHLCLLNDPTKSPNDWWYDFYIQLQQYKHLIIGIIEETSNHKEKEIKYINQLKPLHNGN